jgi:hypothetical protein
MNDTHDQDFHTLLTEYNFVLGITEWTTADLVKMANLIDIELQQRSEEQDYAVHNTSR